MQLARGRDAAVIVGGRADGGGEAEDQAAFHLLPRDGGIDEPSRVDDRDQLIDLQPPLALPRRRHQRDVAAAHCMAGKTLRRTRQPAFPAAEAGRGQQAAREQRRMAQHRHAIGQRVRPGARRQLIDEAFGEEGGVAVGVAAPARRGQADVGGAMIDGAVRDGIGRRGTLDGGGVGLSGGGALRDVGGPIVEQPVADFVVGGRHGDARDQRVDPARRVERRGQPCARRRARGHAHDLFGARPAQLDGALDLPRDDRRLHGGAVVEAGVERPARHHREQRDGAFGKAHGACDGGAALGGRLRCDPDAQAATIGCGGRGARLDGRMQRGGDQIFGGYPFAPLHRFGRVALAADAIAVGLQRRLQRLVDAVARNRRAFGLEDGREIVERAVGGPPVTRDGGDPAFVRDDMQQAGRFHSRLAVDALQPRGAQRALPDRGEDHVGQADIACIIGRAIDLGGQVEPRQFLAIERIGAGRAIDGFGRRRQRGGRRRDLGEAQPLAAQDDETVLRVAILPVGVPAPCRRHHQQRARLRRRVAARPFEHADG